MMPNSTATSSALFFCCHFNNYYCRSLLSLPLLLPFLVHSCRHFCCHISSAAIFFFTSLLVQQLPMAVNSSATYFVTIAAISAATSVTGATSEITIQVPLQENLWCYSSITSEATSAANSGVTSLQLLLPNLLRLFMVQVSKLTTSWAEKSINPATSANTEVEGTQSTPPRDQTENGS